jgi:phosphatidylglycerol lysyltransferase
MSSAATILNAKMPTTTATAPHRARPTLLATSRRLGAAARGIPFTMGALTLLLGMGIATGTLWRSLDPESGLLEALSFGTRRLHDGQWWTFGTGAFVLPRPEFYLVVGALLVVGLGSYERRVGSARAAVALLGTQLAGTLAAAIMMWPFQDSSWAWAASLSGHVDLGLSAGALGVAGAATALMSESWRRRIRVYGLTYLSVMVLRSGLLWDVEHLLAFSAGMLAGPALAGRPRYAIHLPTIDGMRIRAAAGVLIASVAVTKLVDTVYPGLGGVFGDGLPDHPPLHGLALTVGESVIALLVADALRRGRAAAWWVATVGATFVVLNFVVNTQESVPIVDLLGAATVLGVLVTYRNSWRWRTPDGFARRFLRRAVFAVLMFATVFVGSIAVLGQRFRPSPDPLVVLREAMARFTFNPGPLAPQDGLASAVLGVSTLAWGATLIVLLGGWMYADRGPDSGPSECLGRLLRRYGGGSLGWMRTWPAFSTWTSRDGHSAISYCVIGTVAIAIGDPVGPPSHHADAIAGFRTFCRYAGWTPCAFAATSAFVDAAPDLRAVQIGEDTVLDLRDLQFIGKSWQDVRTAINRAKREGISMSTGRLADFPADLRHKIERLSQEWVSGKPLPEMGFTLGTVEHALDPEMRTHVAIDGSGAVQGVTTWLPVHHDGAVVGWTLDLMRRRGDGFRPVMEYLIAESALAFKAEGCTTMSLSVAPLARRTRIAGRRTLLERTLDVMSGVLEPTYGFRSLLAFKAKFQPEFKPVYLVYSRPADLAAISMAISRAYLPNLHARQAVGLLRNLSRGRHQDAA